MDGLDPDRISMLTSGSALVVGSVAPDGEPLAVRGWSTQIVGPRRLRVGMDADERVAVDNVADRMVAVTAADVPTLDSVQIKGRVVDIQPPCAADIDRVHRQSEAFFAAVHETDGHSLDLLRRLLPSRLVMLEIELEEVFDQSPGPRAGTPMEAS